MGALLRMGPQLVVLLTGTGALEMAKNWIAGAIKHPGALHRQLGVPAGQKIPAKKLAKAAKSKSATTRRRVALARTLGGFHKANVLGR